MELIELLEVSDEIAAAPGRNGVDYELARDVIERAQHRICLAQQTLSAGGRPIARRARDQRTSVSDSMPGDLWGQLLKLRHDRACCHPVFGRSSFYIVMAMRQRFAGEARSALLAAIGSNLRPKMVIVVDPDIDIHSSDQVESAVAFRTQPARDAIIVNGLPGGTLAPSIPDSMPLYSRTASAIGIDAPFPCGTVIKSATEVSAAGDICGPAVAEHGHEFVEVVAVPGWQEYDIPELRNRSPAPPHA